jgi:hypothetical protein
MTSPRLVSKADYPCESEGRESLLAHFGVPSFVANRTCFELNGFVGCQTAYGEQGGGIELGSEDAEPVTSCSEFP